MAWHYADIEAELDRYIAVPDDGAAKAKKHGRLLRVAKEKFLAQGYRKTSITEIARDAGVAKGTVYLYFETKASLLIAAVCMEKKASLSRLRPAFEPGLPPGESLRRWIVGAFLMVPDLPLSMRVFSDPQDAAAVMEELPPAVLEHSRERGLALIVEMLEDAVGAKLAPDTAATYGTVVSAVGQFAPLAARPELRGGMSVDAFANVFAEVLVAGVKATLNEQRTELSA